MALVFVGLTLMAFIGASMLAIDVGAVMVARSQTQNAADAAALAAAVALVRDDFTDRSSSGPAVQNALTVARDPANFVLGSVVSITADDVRFIEPGENGASVWVEVTVRRAANRGNALQTFMGQYVGIPTTDIVATATAEAAPSGKLIVIDEDSIDNGNPPNNFTAMQVNDDIATIGQRQALRRFRGSYIGGTLTLYTGQVGDEGWFGVPTIPHQWTNAGPTQSGAQNFWLAGPGLGSGGNPERWLDKIPDVDPLHGAELQELVNQRVCAVVYDSDISMNYGPQNGSLKGANLGIVALTVLSVGAPGGGSSSSLPSVQVRIEDPTTCGEVTENPRPIRLVK
jgi:hypothetical protein